MDFMAASTSLQAGIGFVPVEPMAGKVGLEAGIERDGVLSFCLLLLVAGR